MNTSRDCMKCVVLDRQSFKTGNVCVPEYCSLLLSLLDKGQLLDMQL